MKILKLTCENVKKLRAVEITPAGELVEITGRNGSGKTSVLDSIWWALAGTKHIQAVPIRKGQDKARIRLDLGELIVERRFTPKGSTLTVEKADGARYTSPQSILDALLGALTFDPLAFVTQSSYDQFAALRKLVPLEVDVDELDALNKRDYDVRTEFNRRTKQLRAQADGIAVPDKLPAEPIDTGALKDRMAKASDRAGEIERIRAANTTAADRIAATNVRINAEIQLAKLKVTESLAAIRKMRDEADRLERDTQELHELTEKRANEPREAHRSLIEPAPIDVAALRAELDHAEIVNRGIEQRKRKDGLLAEAKDLQRQADELTSMMETRAIVKDEAIKKAPMPVPGLSFGDGIVTYEGVPFEQAETSAQIRVGVAIAMAANPKLRVIRIKEGSFLDEDNLALIAEMAREQDYQVWVERVNTSGKVGVVIEDGMVVAVDGEPV